MEEGVALSGAKGGPRADRQKSQGGRFQLYIGKQSQLPKDGMTVPKENVHPIIEMSNRVRHHSERICRVTGWGVSHVASLSNPSQP